MIAQKYLLGSKNLVTCGVMGVGLWVNPLLYWDFQWIPSIQPHFSPLLLVRSAAVRFCWTSPRAMATLSTVGHDLCSPSSSNSHGPSRKTLNSSHPLLFVVIGFYFISLFSLLKSQMKEQIIWAASIDSNTETYIHFISSFLDHSNGY